MNKVKIAIIILISISIGFIIAVFAFREGFESVSTYHLEWNQSFKSPTKDCVYFNNPISDNSAILNVIFCIKNNYKLQEKRYE